MSKKEITTCKFENDGWILRNLFFCNDDIISVLCKQVMLRFVTTYRSERGYGF